MFSIVTGCSVCSCVFSVEKKDLVQVVAGCVTLFSLFHSVVAINQVDFFLSRVVSSSFFTLRSLTFFFEDRVVFF